MNEKSNSTMTCAIPCPVKGMLAGNENKKSCAYWMVLLCLENTCELRRRWELKMSRRKAHFFSVRLLNVAFDAISLNNSEEVNTNG